LTAVGWYAPYLARYPLSWPPPPVKARGPSSHAAILLREGWDIGGDGYVCSTTHAPPDEMNHAWAGDGSFRESVWNRWTEYLKDRPAAICRQPCWSVMDQLGRPAVNNSYIME
jgi:hypothetical protein